MSFKKIPSSAEIQKKLKLSTDLFAAAFEIKRYQLEKKYPQKTQKELNAMTMELFEKGSK